MHQAWSQLLGLSRGSVRNFVFEACCRHLVTNLSPNITANWVLAMYHSFGGRFHPFEAWLDSQTKCTTLSWWYNGKKLQPARS